LPRNSIITAVFSAAAGTAADFLLQQCNVPDFIPNVTFRKSLVVLLAIHDLLQSHHKKVFQISFSQDDFSRLAEIKGNLTQFTKILCGPS